MIRDRGERVRLTRIVPSTAKERREFDGQHRAKRNGLEGRRTSAADQPVSVLDDEQGADRAVVALERACELERLAVPHIDLVSLRARKDMRPRGGFGRTGMEPTAVKSGGQRSDALLRAVA